MSKSYIPKVSVIIPIQNLENYLEKSLDSVVNQTFKEIEIICVDDASTDNSPKILNDFAKRDDRITIIRQEKQQGQASARNRALALAKGEYIAFVDGDDWVDVRMIESLYENALKNDSDIVMCATKVFDEQEQQFAEDTGYYSLSIFDDSFDNKTFSHFDCPELILDINVAIWSKLYKKDFLYKNKIRFSDGYIFEDLLFFFETYLQAKTVSVSREKFYFYRINRFGSTMRKVEKQILDRIEMVSQTFKLFKELPYYEEIKFKIIDWLISDLFHRYTLVSSKYKKEFFYRMKKVFLDLDFKGIDPKILENIYYFKEFQLVTENEFEACNSKFFDTFTDSKKKNQELKSKYEEQIHLNSISFQKEIDSLKTFYNQELENQKISQEKIFEEYHQSELKNQREWHENYIKEELEKQSQYHENNLKEELFKQSQYHENNLKEQSQFYENNLKEELEKQSQYYENRLKEESEKQSQLHESCLKEELQKQSQYYENEIQRKLESQQKWFEGEIERRISEVDVWHNNNLENHLKGQKEYYETELSNLESKLKQEIEDQRLSYEQQISDQLAQFDKDTKYLKLAIKALKKVRNIGNNFKKAIVRPVETSQEVLETKTPKVSVILPIYNVDKYLRQSLDSLINQTLKDIEIICVNDGSTDNCFNILEEYSQKDSRIKVIHKKNAGTGAARNDGLRIATGECIGFVDPDDWVRENMFERLYSLIQEKDVDIVMCTPGGFDEQNQQERDFPYFVDANFKSELENGIFNWRSISPFSYPMCVWNKLYKKELFDKHKIDFAEGLDFEDHKVIFGSLLTAEKICFVREKLYIYRFNREGSILTDNNRRLIDHIKIFDIVENILNSTGTMQPLRNDFITYKIHNLLYYYSMIKEEHKDEYYSKMVDAIAQMNLSNEETEKLCGQYVELAEVMTKIQSAQKMNI